MGNNSREPDILEIARKEGKVTVEDLASRFGVSWSFRRSSARLVCLELCAEFKSPHIRSGKHRSNLLSVAAGNAARTASDGGLPCGPGRANVPTIIFQNKRLVCAILSR